MKIKKVLVLGAGTMGRGIAQWFAQNNVEVHLTDNYQEVCHKSQLLVRESWEKLQTRGKFTLEEVKLFSANFKIKELEDIDNDYDLLIEAIIENMEIKKDCFSNLDKRINEKCIFATNTSSLSVTNISTCLSKERQKQFLGLHFFNPAPIMKLVEIVKSSFVKEDIVQDLYNFFQLKGKAPAICKDGPGFIVNRVARSFYGEALHISKFDCLEHYIEIDKALKSSGFKMGPFQLMDLIGVDTNYEVTKSVWKSFYMNERFIPHSLQRQMVNSGRHGRKTNRGFYNYEDRHNLKEQIPTVQQTPSTSTIVKKSNPSKLIIISKESVYSSKITNQNNDVILIEKCSDIKNLKLEKKHENMLILDLSLTTTKNKILFYQNNKNLDLRIISEITGADEKKLQTFRNFSGFFTPHFITPAGITEVFSETINDQAQVTDFLQKLNIKAHFLKIKKLGPITSRIVSMIINEAYYSLEDDLCSTEDLDTAMINGANYPLGPFEWCYLTNQKAVQLCLDKYYNIFKTSRYACCSLLTNNQEVNL